MELRRYLSILRRRIMLVIAVVIAALVAGWMITPKTAEYTATAKLYVGSAAIDSAQVSGDRVAGFDRVIKTFTAMLPSSRIVSAGIDEAGLDRSAGAVAAQTQATQIENTNLIQLSVTDRQPQAARALANGIAKGLVAQVKKVEPANQQDTVLSV